MHTLMYYTTRLDRGYRWAGWDIHTNGGSGSVKEQNLNIIQITTCQKTSGWYISRD